MLDLVELFTGFDHVLYLDNFFSSMEFGTVRPICEAYMNPSRAKSSLPR